MVDYYNHVKHCTTHPKFLHSNSTSHRWVFGAIAELIDNAIDPDVNASQFCIDMKEFNNEPCLVFMDNGSGLVPEKLHKMLSFGHSKKQMTPGDRSIGKHGNGFKSGTMRLGKDVLVLTKCTDSMTAGFLSQTFLADTAAEDILIPQVSWDRQGNRLSPVDLEIEESLKAICKYSIFPDEESLLAQLEAIPQTGAILIISNLRRHEGVLELDFETDPHDIRITSEITSNAHFQQLRPNQPNTTVVPMDFSLRAYVSILYKVPRMQIFIRDKKVKTKRIAGLLSQKETETYKPYGVAESIKIELGFNTENKNLYGMMLYHRNRLIKAYMRVGMQLEENERGMGVIGLAEADFLQPTHNKQDFDDTTAYRRLLKKLSDVLAEYWWEKKERANILQIQPETRRRGPAGSHSEDVPDVNWVQCDNPSCLKWRVLPAGTVVEKLPDIWYCEYHPDPKYRRHEEPEQEWDTTIQHEIVERRKERKREYDREKKEREAEKKRQRLEAATRDSVAVLERQKEELAKEIQEQLERERQALEEQKCREEEVRKLNEEWALIKQDCAQMESKREEMLREQKELEKQLAAAQEELARKAKEKEEIALLQAQKEAEKQAEKEAELAAEKARLEQQSQVQVMAPVENGHVLESRIESTTATGTGRKGGGSKSSRGASGKEKRGILKGAAPLQLHPVTPVVPVSTTRQPQLLPEPNQTSQTFESNGSHLPNISGVLRVSSGRGSTTAQRPKQGQASLPPRHGKTATFTREDVPRAPAGTPQQPQRKGTNPGGSRKQGRAVHISQAPLLEWGPTGDLPNPVLRTGTGDRLSNGDTPPTASASLQSSSPESHQTGQAKSLENTLASNQPTHAEVSPSTVDERSSTAPDPAHQNTVISDDRITGSLATGSQLMVTATLGRGPEQPLRPQGDTFVRSGGQQGQPEGNVSESGRLCIDLPMDSSVSKSESIRSLDKEFFSSQRRLRLALNTLTKLGGLNDGKVYDLDLLPTTDEEVIKICEKVRTIREKLDRFILKAVLITQESVESKLTKYRQDVASLKAELAYLMADKYQHGQGQSWNFKIQSVINKWGVMEVSKKS